VIQARRTTPQEIRIMMAGTTAAPTLRRMEAISVAASTAVGAEMEAAVTEEGIDDNPSGRVGDAARAFCPGMFVTTNNNFVTFRFGAKQWRYDCRTHFLSCGDGRSREAS
jgi:hypothetical protein